jgi:hypothetical protein
MISEPTATPARNNFLMTDNLHVGNEKHMRLLAASGDPVVTPPKNERLPERAGSRWPPRQAP